MREHFGVFIGLRIRGVCEWDCTEHSSHTLYTEMLENDLVLGFFPKLNYAALSQLLSKCPPPS